VWVPIVTNCREEVFSETGLPVKGLSENQRSGCEP
jgi:hypothetical protein